MNFRDIKIRVDAKMSSKSIITCAMNGQTYIFMLADLAGHDLPTDEAIARDIANRLLDRSGPALTLDMVQRMIDSTEQWTAPISHIIMSPATRREYLALIEPDRRYTSDV